MARTDTVTLRRPTGRVELALVEASDWRAWPPGPPGPPKQPILCPVPHEDHALRTARCRNAPASGAGCATTFRGDAAFTARSPGRQAGRRTLLEMGAPLAEGRRRVPAEEPAGSDKRLAGPAEAVREFRCPS